MKEELTPESHPAYGLLQVHRVSGCREALFGSSIEHQNTIRIRVCRGVVDRGTHHDFYYERGELIEVEMSPAQWAEAITSMNSGSGTPCTILHVQGERTPPCPGRNPRKLLEDEFKNDLKKLERKLEQKVTDAKLLLEKKALTKADREKILESLSTVQRFLWDNAPFIQTMFNEVVEDTIHEAKSELEAHMTNAMIRAGQVALIEQRDQAPFRVPLLEDKS